MNEKLGVMAVLGLVIALSGYFLNEIFITIALAREYNLPVTIPPHSGPLIVGTVWLFLIPLGIMIILVSIVFEIKDRYQKTDNNDIWE